MFKKCIYRIQFSDKVCLYGYTSRLTKEFISKTTPPHPCPLPPGERGLIISPPLTVASGDSPRRGGDEGEGDTCGFTNDRVSKVRGVYGNRLLILKTEQLSRLHALSLYPRHLQEPM